jgi:hypothetical protein
MKDKRLESVLNRTIMPHTHRSCQGHRSWYRSLWGSLRTAKTGAPGRAPVVTGACCVGAEQTLANNRRELRSRLFQLRSTGAIRCGDRCLAPRQPMLPGKLLFRSFLADSSPVLFRSARPCFLRVAWSIPLLVSLCGSGFAHALLLGLNLGL